MTTTLEDMKEAYLHWRAGDSYDDGVWEQANTDFDIAITEVWQLGFDAGVRSER